MLVAGTLEKIALQSPRPNEAQETEETKRQATAYRVEFLDLVVGGFVTLPLHRPLLLGFAGMLSERARHPL
jgi:hypothetical protein